MQAWRLSSAASEPVVMVWRLDSDTWGDTPFREIMHPHQHNQLRDVVMLPCLLIVAFAAWTATYVSGLTSRR